MGCAERIVVREPELNPNKKRYRQWVVRDTALVDRLGYEIDLKGITPKTHAEAIDLCCGDGGVAQYLQKRGWDHLTLVDQFKPVEPLVATDDWRYLNLGQLRFALEHGEELPSDIESMRGRFDVVTLVQGFIGRREEELKICKFFAKPEAYIYCI